jgi:prepilin-type N-terminal cleavage/methylation domain-containing protein
MNKKGFTLVELIIVIVTVGIIVGMAAPFISAILDSWLFNKTERDVVFSARFALNRMVREIRQIKNVASIITFTNTEFDFLHIDNTRIDFKQSGNSLLRNSDELTDKLQNPGGLTFIYLDSSGNATSTKNDIRMVRIRLILVSGDSTVTIQSLARFRNI